MEAILRIKKIKAIMEGNQMIETKEETSETVKPRQKKRSTVNSKNEPKISASLQEAKKKQKEMKEKLAETPKEIDFMELENLVNEDSKKQKIELFEETNNSSNKFARFLNKKQEGQQVEIQKNDSSNKFARFLNKQQKNQEEEKVVLSNDSSPNYTDKFSRFLNKQQKDQQEQNLKNENKLKDETFPVCKTPDISSLKDEEEVNVSEEHLTSTNTPIRSIPHDKFTKTLPNNASELKDISSILHQIASEVGIKETQINKIIEDKKDIIDLIDYYLYILNQTQ